jgi:hypothetical protein
MTGPGASGGIPLPRAVCLGEAAVQAAGVEGEGLEGVESGGVCVCGGCDGDRWGTRGAKPWLAWGRKWGLLRSADTAGYRRCSSGPYGGAQPR